MNILQIRHQFTTQSTISNLYADPEFMRDWDAPEVSDGFIRDLRHHLPEGLPVDYVTLEDAYRGEEKKFAGEMCVPEGAYDAKVSESKRFKRDLIMLSNKDGYIVDNGKISFKGIRVHRGNRAKDTHGCILAGMSTHIPNWIDHSTQAEKELTEIVRNAGGAKWYIVNAFPHRNIKL